MSDEGVCIHEESNHIKHPRLALAHSSYSFHLLVQCSHHFRTCIMYIISDKGSCWASNWPNLDKKMSFHTNLSVVQPTLHAKAASFGCHVDLAPESTVPHTLMWLQEYTHTHSGHWCMFQWTKTCSLPVQIGLSKGMLVHTKNYIVHFVV